MISNRKMGIIIGLAFVIIIAFSMLIPLPASNIKNPNDGDDISIKLRPNLGHPIEIALALLAIGIPIVLFPFLKLGKLGSALRFVGATLAVRFWGNGIFAPLVFSVGSLIFYYLLFRYRLVPKLLYIWGLIGAFLFFVSVFLPLFGYYSQSPIFLIFHTPGGINQMALAVWLIFKGFSSNSNTT